MTVTPATGATGFFAGVRILGQGLRLWISAPRLMLMGAIPALIVAAVYAAGIIALAVNLDAVAEWTTPFAAEWTEPLRTLVRIVAGLAAVGIVVLLVVYTFTAIVLAVGDPFYERISRRVDERLGNAPVPVETPFWTGVGRAIGEGVRILIPTIGIALLLFAAGFIPIVGQVVVPVLGAVFGGWFLALELTGFAFEARGGRLRDRRRALAAHRSRTIGFGAATYLLFLIPFAAVIVMPAAVAGATILARQSIEDAPPAPRTVA